MTVSPLIDDEEKQGFCPQVNPLVRFSCSTDIADCHNDFVCPGTQKCCEDGCTRTCVHPEITTGVYFTVFRNFLAKLSAIFKFFLLLFHRLSKWFCSLSFLNLSGICGNFISVHFDFEKTNDMQITEVYWRRGSSGLNSTVNPLPWCYFLNEFFSACLHLKSAFEKIGSSDYVPNCKPSGMQLFKKVLIPHKISFKTKSVFRWNI